MSRMLVPRLSPGMPTLRSMLAMYRISFRPTFTVYQVSLVTYTAIGGRSRTGTTGDVDRAPRLGDGGLALALLGHRHAGAAAVRFQLLDRHRVLEAEGAVADRAEEAAVEAHVHDVVAGVDATGSGGGHHHGWCSSRLGEAPCLQWIQCTTVRPFFHPRRAESDFQQRYTRSVISAAGTLGCNRPGIVVECIHDGKEGGLQPPHPRRPLLYLDGQAWGRRGQHPWARPHRPGLERCLRRGLPGAGTHRD